MINFKNRIVKPARFDIEPPKGFGPDKAGNYHWHRFSGCSIDDFEKYDEAIEVILKKRRAAQVNNERVRAEFKETLVDVLKVMGVTDEQLDFPKRQEAILDFGEAIWMQGYSDYPNASAPFLPKVVYFDNEAYPVQAKTFKELFGKCKQIAAQKLRNDMADDARTRAAYKYVVEHGLEIETWMSSKDIFRLANDHAKDAYFDEREGGTIEVSHSDGDSCTWIVGERRCDCGFNRYYLEIDGDFINGFYDYGQWC